MHKAKANGVELEYEVTGSGEAVLLIGPGPLADGFSPFCSERALVDHYCLIRYRQRGQGRGTPPSAPVTFAEHAADAAALLADVGVSRAHVAGHSTGAAIALQLAADFPDVVHSLALLEPTLLGLPAAAAFFEKAQPAVAAYAAGDCETAIARFLSMASGLDWETCRGLLDRHVPGSVARAVDDAGIFFGSYLPALSTWEFGAAQAATVSSPVLSVLGTDTDPWFVEGHEMLHAWFPKAEDCVISGIAHLLHLQAPRPVAQGVAAFFARHPMDGDVSGEGDPHWVREPGRVARAQA